MVKGCEPGDRQTYLLLTLLRMREQATLRIVTQSANLRFVLALQLQ